MCGCDARCFFRAEDGIRDAQESRGLGDVYKGQVYAGLVVLPFAGRLVRGFVRRIHRPPRLTYVDGRLSLIHI